MESEQTLLGDDMKARAEALDVGRSFIVQAPAGSGKTELLIQRYLRLLTTVEHPEEILAITFTRKAAAEMRMRVLLALQNAARDASPSESHLKITFEAARAVLARDTDLGWNIAGNPRRLRIQTLDALNASIARMRPLTETTAGGGDRVGDENEMNALYRIAATATLEWLGDRGDEGAATLNVITHVDSNVGLYVNYLTGMLRTRDQWLPFISSGLVSVDESDELRRAFEQNLGRVVTERLGALKQQVPLDAAAEFLALAVYAAENLRADNQLDNSICELASVSILPGENESDLSAWIGLAELLLTQQGTVRKQVNKNQGFPPGDDGQKRAMLEVLKSLRDEREFTSQLHRVRVLPPVRYTDEQWSVLLSLFRLLPTAVAELKHQFLSRGVSDYIEVALAAGSALGSANEPGDVALLLDYQVRHILVDEMQDTSKAQYRMLEALTGGWQAGDGRTLFCVGDPMQSIYRFRNAEVAQFLLARQAGIGSVQLVPLLLRQNFRSGEHLVAWFNAVFPRVLPEADDAANGAVAYAQAIPADKYRDKGRCDVHPIFGGNVDDEATVACDIIEQTLGSHPDDDVAVLVRARTQLPALLAKLRNANIPYQAVDIERLTDLPEIIDVLALTRAVSHLGDRVAWLALLRSPWVSLDWTDLHQLVRNARNESVLELLNDHERCSELSDFGRRAVADFMQRISVHLVADRTRPLHQRVEAAWFALGGPALLEDLNAVANVYRFLDVLSGLEVGGTVPDVAQLTGLLDSEHVSSNVAARLQIMTMHKAKGLQFDHVVLYGLGRYPSARTASVMSWFDLPDKHGREEKVISPIGRRDEVEHDPIHRFIELTKSAKDKHEHGRLLYVACTRAKKTLHLIGNVSASGDRMRPPHSSSLLVLLWPSVESAFDDAFSADSLPAETEEALWEEPILRRFESSWAVPSVSTVPGQRAAPSERTESHEVNYDWVGGDARLAGTIVHRWLQFAAQGRVRLRLDQLDLLRSTNARWLQELGASEEIVGTVCDRVDAALKNVLTDEKGRWLVAGSGAAELALSGVVDGRVESIVIDRILIDDDGTHWIVDYKTSSHEGGNLDGFLKSECDRYRGQLRKYEGIYRAYSQQAARCALYFPLLKAFVEVVV